jgi:hypothetical protein
MHFIRFVSRTNSEGKKPIELADKNSYSGKAIFEFLSQQGMNAFQ